MCYVNCSCGEFMRIRSTTVLLISSCCVVAVCAVSSCVYLCVDMMMNMGYSRKEIEESLIQQKYNDVMATYLLLARRGSDVSCIASIF